MKPSGGTSTPLVPVTGSRMKPAIVWAPSSSMVSSIRASASAVVSQPRWMPWYGLSTCTTPGIPGSAGQRRGSPVSVMLPAVPP